MSSATVPDKVPNIRYHGLDALRAWAMSMGIVLHAAWVMIPGDAGAPASDASAHGFYEWLCLAIHTFRMQLFFVLAGFFACLLLRKRGVWKFAKNRISRIVVPLAVFWLVLCPVCMWQYNAAGLKSGAIQSSLSAWELTKVYFSNIAPDNTMLLHLWFLYYLAAVYVFALALRSIVLFVDRSGSMRQSISSLFGKMIIAPSSVVLLAAICAPLLMFMGGFWGIEIGLGTLYFKWPGFFSYAIYFLVGWLLFRNVDKLDMVVRGWRWQLVLGLGLTIPYFFLNGFASRTGYATWNYPQLAVEHVRFDHETQGYDYPGFRQAMLDAQPRSVAAAVWEALPTENRTFVEQHTTATANQFTGLLNAVNKGVLGNRDFADNVALAFVDLPRNLRNAYEVDSSAMTADEVARFNRSILEEGFAGIIHPHDVTRPYYHLIRAAYAFGYSLTTWLLIFGCIGFFQAYCSGESKFWRYFSDSSYWMYLAHIPVQFQILLLFGEESWPASLKFCVYVFGTIAVLWPSYHYLVRPTWIGWLLNGRMVPIRVTHDELVGSRECRPTATPACVETKTVTIS